MGSSWPGRGAFMSAITRLFCQPARPNATRKAAPVTIRRERSSSRWSTTVSRSSWPRGLMRRIYPRRALGLRKLVVLFAADRALEFAHPVPQRTAEVGQLLGPEHDQCDHE